MNAATAKPGSAHPTGPSRKKPGAWRARVAIGIVLLGMALVVAAAGYLLYADRARASLGRLEYTVSAGERASWRPAAAPGDSAQAPTAPGAGGADAPETMGQLYPARLMNPQYWAAPELAGTDPYGGSGLPSGFQYVSDEERAAGLGSGALASRLVIRAIRLDSTVGELEILDLGDSRAYETPANTVGHIPATANPGEARAGWYFGHLESPIRGEGNVFRKLPDIPGLLKNDPVDVIVETEDGEFLYRVVETSVVHQDDLSLVETADATLTLVACVPARVYDHRLLVTAELLGYRPG